MKHLEEDFERLSEKDKMYLIEKQREIDEEYWQWVDEHPEEIEQKPAEIKIEKHEHKKSVREKK